MKTCFILGSNDPEMVAVEEVVTARGHVAAYALVGGSRVYPETAYQCDGMSKRIEIEIPKVGIRIFRWTDGVNGLKLP